ncbi:MAG TPA: hypothetical protein VKA54_07520 [Gemmatimonadaceae bacterium]|nr:hypothetical protein [Gemmatimonadaceae bacterium]
MRAALVVTGALLLSVATPALAHRVDEYLQATTISVGSDRVQAQIRLVPGIEVLPIVLASIDTDRDGVISDAEQRTYSERVLRDLSLSVDGVRLPLRLLSSKFADLELMRDGRGVILIDFDAEVPRGAAERRLLFENRHFSRIAEYLVNSLVPRDPAISLGAQHRNYEQSSYRLDYVQTGARSGPLPVDWWSQVRSWLVLAALLPLAWLALRHERRVGVVNQSSTAGSAALGD